ncbi:MAG: hypothetical protein BMS9Abin29_2457 [Gemmatimonadota bacterium]|nr:MAG: hypothetical protein BMS9Abin29_2457 [Gemmatimonadota bacterium]
MMILSIPISTRNGLAPDGNRPNSFYGITAIGKAAFEQGETESGADQPEVSAE